jgi:hypothetical protein
MKRHTRKETVTLTGRLTRSRIVGTTREKTIELPAHHVSTDWQEYHTPAREFTAAGREYALLYLLVARRVGHGWRRDVRRVVVWNLDRGPLHPARLARKGDKVRITGYPDAFDFERDGETHRVEQIVLTDLEFLQIKAPPYEPGPVAPREVAS